MDRSSIFGGGVATAAVWLTLIVTTVATPDGLPRPRIHIYPLPERFKGPPTFSFQRFLTPVIRASEVRRPTTASPLSATTTSLIHPAAAQYFEPDPEKAGFFLLEHKVRVPPWPADEMPVLGR